MDSIDEYYCDEQLDEQFNLNEIIKVLDDKAIKTLYKKLDEDYVLLVVDILSTYINVYADKGLDLSDKQKFCIAKFIYQNNLEYLLDESEKDNNESIKKDKLNLIENKIDNALNVDLIDLLKPIPIGDGLERIPNLGEVIEKVNTIINKVNKISFNLKL